MSDLQQTVADLAARLERLETVQAIERLKYRYWRACDAKDPDTFRDCFVKQGADIDYGPGLGAFHDREPLVDVFAGLARRRENDRWLFHDIHHGHHPVIELHADGSATGQWTFWFMRVNLAEHTVEQASMEYRDRYVREDGEWKIQRSHVIPLTTGSFPIPEGTRVGPGPAA
jgi:hypothetical protein